MLRNVFQGREVGKQRSRAFIATVGIGTLLVGAVAFYIGYDAAKTVPGRGYYNLKAQFANAENLANHYEARIGGVRAGQILNPHVENGRAVVELRLSDKHKPLLSDTRLQVRLRSAVGVRYLEIIPGTRGTPLPEGATIPLSAPKPSVALDKVLGTFDAQTRAKTRAFLNQLGAGTLSRGADINESVRSAPSFLGDLGSLSRAIVQRSGASGRLITASDHAADAFDPVRREIADGFAPEAAALRPFTEAREDLQDTLRAADVALGTLQAQLPDVARFLSAARGLAADGAPTVRIAARPLAQTTALLRTARTPLADARRTLQLADRAVPPTLGLLETVKPVLPNIEQALDDVLPTAAYVGPRACGLSMFSTAWNQWMKYGDSVGNFIRFQFLGARGDVLAGDTHTPKVPVAPVQGVLDNFHHAQAYPGPCKGQYSATGGPPRPTAQESAKGLRYTAARQPGFEAPGYRGLDESNYAGGR